MKNGILYRCLETKHYLCTIIQNKMGINKLKVVLTEEHTSIFGCAAIQSSAEDILQHLQG